MLVPVLAGAGALLAVAPPALPSKYPLTDMVTDKANVQKRFNELKRYFSRVFNDPADTGDLILNPVLAQVGAWYERVFFFFLILWLLFLRECVMRGCFCEFVRACALLARALISRVMSARECSRARDCKLFVGPRTVAARWNTCSCG